MCRLHVKHSYSHALKSILDLYSLAVIINKMNCPTARAWNTSKLEGWWLDVTSFLKNPVLIRVLYIQLFSPACPM